MARSAGADEDGAGPEHRPSDMGDSTQLHAQLGRRRGRADSPIHRAGSPPRLSHLLGQSRSYHMEVPRESIDFEDRPSLSRSRSPLHQV